MKNSYSQSFGKFPEARALCKGQDFERRKLIKNKNLEPVHMQFLTFNVI